MIEIDEGLKPGDKLVLCAWRGLTVAAVCVEW